MKIIKFIGAILISIGGISMYTTVRLAELSNFMIGLDFVIGLIIMLVCFSVGIILIERK